MKTLLVAVMSLALISCGPSDKSSPTAKKSHSSAVQEGSATITADPNPIPPGGVLGETTISWNTGNDTPGEVYVAKRSGPEKRFAAGASGSAKAKWIQVHTIFEFRLYEGTAHSKLLAKVQVTHQP